MAGGKKPKGKRQGRIAKAVARTEDEAPPATPVGPYEPKPEKDETPWGAEGLTKKQYDFVEHLLSDAAGNATLAAELAGYNAENRVTLACTASENLRKPYIREAIARRAAKYKLTPEWVREMTAALAASNMGNFLGLDHRGQPYIDWRQAEQIGAFVQIRKYREKAHDTGQSMIVVERTIETHNPAPYLQTLARMFGLIDGDINVNVNLTAKVPPEYACFVRELESVERERNSAAGRMVSPERN